MAKYKENTMTFSCYILDMAVRGGCPVAQDERKKDRKTAEISWDTRGYR